MEKEVKLPKVERSARQGVQSVEVTLRVLLAVAEGPGPRPLKDISAMAGLAPSSAHRHLTTLVRTGMVEQDASTGRYELGAGTMDLGLKALARREPVRLGAEIIGDLRDQVQHSVFLAVWASHGPTIVRWEDGPQPVTVNVRVGSVLPLMRSATGRVFLTWLPPSITETILTSERAKDEDVETLRSRTRRHGVGSVEGDLLPGVASLSAPVFDHRGHLVAAISTLGTAAVFDSASDGPTGIRLRDAAQSLSKRLCFSGEPTW